MKQLNKTFLQVHLGSSRPLLSPFLISFLTFSWILHSLCIPQPGWSGAHHGPWVVDREARSVGRRVVQIRRVYHSPFIHWAFFVYDLLYIQSSLEYLHLPPFSRPRRPIENKTSESKSRSLSPPSLAFLLLPPTPNRSRNVQRGLLPRPL